MYHLFVLEHSTWVKYSVTFPHKCFCVSFMPCVLPVCRVTLWLWVEEFLSQIMSVKILQICSVRRRPAAPLPNPTEFTLMMTTTCLLVRRHFLSVLSHLVYIMQCLHVLYENSESCEMAYFKRSSCQMTLVQILKRHSTDFTHQAQFTSHEIKHHISVLSQFRLQLQTTLIMDYTKCNTKKRWKCKKHPPTLEKTFTDHQHRKTDSRTVTYHKRKYKHSCDRSQVRLS